MHKKFEINRTKIKGGCQSVRKVVTHDSNSDLPLMFFFQKVRKATPMLVQAANASLQEALHKEVNSKVLKSDLQIKEALQKLVTSKAVTENIANSIAASLTPALHASFKDASNSSIVPG